MQLGGLHHVTAVTGVASQNVTFYTQTLGLRLVKKTVNQDDVSAYHLFYADAVGSPGTDVTFFDWPQTAKNRNGAGSIARIALSAPGQEVLGWWMRRLSESDAESPVVVEEDGHRLVRFRDPEGQELALIDAEGAPGGIPWERSPVPVEKGIRGIHSVTLMVQDLRPTASVLTDVMGFEQVREYQADNDPKRRVVVFAIGEGGAGKEVHVEHGLHLIPGRLGRGGVHHVAFRTPDDKEHQAWRQRIAQAGLGVTPIIDRFYFKSIYFREPGGILFEIATDGPGFAADEDPEHLGEGLALPPFLEPKRAYIESQLKPI